MGRQERRRTEDATKGNGSRRLTESGAAANTGAEWFQAWSGAAEAYVGANAPMCRGRTGVEKFAERTFTRKRLSPATAAQTAAAGPYATWAWTEQ